MRIQISISNVFLCGSFKQIKGQKRMEINQYRVNYLKSWNIYHCQNQINYCYCYLNFITNYTINYCYYYDFRLNFHYYYFIQITSVIIVVHNYLRGFIYWVVPKWSYLNANRWTHFHNHLHQFIPILLAIFIIII